MSQSENNEYSSHSQEQEQLITPAQMQSMLLEQNRRHEEMLKYQETMFRAQLEQQRQTTNIQAQKSSRNNSLSNDRTTPDESSNNISRSRHSQSIIIPEKKWDKDHFREILERQQSSLKQNLAKRQYSSTQRKVFDYSADLKQDLSNVVSKRVNSFQRIQKSNASAAKPKANNNGIYQGLSTLTILNKPMHSKGRNLSMNRTLTKEDSQNSNVTNSNSIITSLIEQKNNTTVLNCTSSSVQNYLEYRHMVTRDKLNKYKADKMKDELSKCTSKPNINKKSLKIARKLQKNPVERLYKGQLEKNNKNALIHKLQMWEKENTFSPQINNQSRSLTRTVEDLYTWNEQRQGKLNFMKNIYQNVGGKVEICPGSKNIIRDLDSLVDKCNDKINSVRSHSKSESTTKSHIEAKHNALTFVRQAEAKSIKKNKLIIKKPKKQRKKKIRGNYFILKLYSKTKGKQRKC